MKNVKITDSEFDRLVKFMHKTYGIDLSKKRVLIEGRLSKMVAEKGCSSYTEYFDKVFNDSSGLETVKLVNKLTTNHTFFMREPEHYTYLKEVILPYMVANSKDNSLRI